MGILQKPLLLNGEKNPEYAILPHTWKDNPLEFATYRLSLCGLISGKDYTFKVFYMSTTYRLYLNGRIAAGNGIAGITSKNSVPEYKPGLINFISKSEKAELILQVSNYNHRWGGAH